PWSMRSTTPMWVMPSNSTHTGCPTMKLSSVVCCECPAATVCCDLDGAVPVRHRSVGDTEQQDSHAQRRSGLVPHVPFQYFWRVCAPVAGVTVDHCLPVYNDLDVRQLSTRKCC